MSFTHLLRQFLDNLATDASLTLGEKAKYPQAGWVS